MEDYCLFKNLKGIVRTGGAKSEECGSEKSKKGDSLSHYYLSNLCNKLKNNARVEHIERVVVYWNKRPV
jgi:hypothetical protein